MKKARAALVIVCMIAALGACLSAPVPKGPLDSFAFLSASNPGLSVNVNGAISLAGEAREIHLTVPPGTDVRHLVATLSLSKEAVIAVISSGSRVVQQNGVTPNDFSVPVTYAIEVAGDKNPWTYKVVVREADTDARLGAFSVPPGAIMTPSFDPSVKAYSIQVPFATTSLQLRAKGVSGTLKSITIDGSAVPGNSAGVTVAFASVAERAVAVETIAEDGVTREQYALTIQRAAPDTDATLALLDIGQNTMQPVFSPTQASYQVVVPFGARQIQMHARAHSPFATATLFAASGSAATAALSFTGNLLDRNGALVDLPPTQETVVVVQMTAQDGSNQQYQVDVQRAAPDHNADLASLGVSAGTLSPAFSQTVRLYTITLPDAVGSIVITPIPASPVATVSLADQPDAPITASKGLTVSLEPGTARMFELSVRAEDGLRRSYRVQVTRPRDSNAWLQTLQITGGQLIPAFDPKVIVYDVKAASDAPVTISATAQSRYASVAINGRPAEATPRIVPVPKPGVTLSMIVEVAAQDGGTVRYTLRISHDAPDAKPSTAQPAAGTSGGTSGQQTASPPAGQTMSAPVPTPRDNGGAHITVVAQTLKIGTRESAAMAAASDEIGSWAIVTVHSYRSDGVVTRYPAPVQVSADKSSITLNARSNGISMAPNSLLEVEVVIQTKAGKFLYYKTAQHTDTDLHVGVPFLLYGDKSAIAWPAPGTMAVVAGVESSLVAGKERAMDKADFARDPSGAVTISVQLSNAMSGAPYGTTTVLSGSGAQRQRVLLFARPILVPEGATVTWVLSATAKNGKIWTATGTSPVWTTSPSYGAGFEPVTISVSDDLVPSDRPGEQDSKQ